MTVNERLYCSNQFKAFDTAVKMKDKSTLIKILKKVRVPDNLVIQILKHYKLLD